MPECSPLEGETLKKIIRIGVGGPVGSGKTSLIERMTTQLLKEGFKVGIISNDVVTKEDAIRLRRRLCEEEKLLEPDLVVGVETGGCPHTAVREDPSINIDALKSMEETHSDLDLILLESGGDNITITFSPAVADYFIYVIDVAGGDKYPRKDGLGIVQSDLLIINKIDLAPYVEADLQTMAQDAKAMRKGKPFVFTNCHTGEGIDVVVARIRQDVLFK